MKNLRLRTRSGDYGGSYQTLDSRVHPGGVLSRMARQRHPSKESKREMEDVCRLHRFEQGMPKGQLPFTKNRLARGLHGWAQATDIYGHLLRVQPDKDG